MDCDSKGCRFNSYYLPMKNYYSLIKNSNIKNFCSDLNYFKYSKGVLNVKILKKIFKINNDRLNKLTVINITKPKNQFYLNFFNGVVYNYSTGMIIKSLKLESRSLRRIKPGFYLFLSFFLKKFKNLNELGKNIIILRNFNKINILKNFLLKFFLKKNSTIILKISKNSNFKNYKKISYINKRLRRKFPIE